MGSVIEDIYRDRRQLTHENAARELAICWNGTAVDNAHGLLSAVQAKYQNNSYRKSANIS